MKFIKEPTGEAIRKAGGYREYFKNTGIMCNLKEEEIKKHFQKSVKIGRNEKCPCNSNKKYKKCCGKIW